MSALQKKIQAIIVQIFKKDCRCEEGLYDCCEFTVQITSQWKLVVEISKDELNTDWLILKPTVIVLGFSPGLRAAAALNFYKVLDNDMEKILEEYFTQILEKLYDLLPGSLPVSVLYGLSD